MKTILQTSGALLFSFLVFCQSALGQGPYTITTSPSTPAFGTTSGGGTFADGSSRTVIATPASGYQFYRWTEGGNERSRSASYTFTVDRDRALVAEFDIAMPELLGGEVTPGTVYSFRAYAINGVGISYSNIGTFTTPGGATVTTASPTNVTTTSATLGGTATGSGITARGVVYAQTDSFRTNPLIGGDGSGNGVINLPATGTTGPFTVVATDLTPGTAYNFKAYATNSVGTSYGPLFCFTPGGPTVTTPTVTSVTGSTVTLGGNVTSAGGGMITERGVVFTPTTTKPNPLITGNQAGVVIVTTPGTTGVFTVNATGLAPGTAYTFRAYATTSGGTGYSTTGSFITTGGPTLAPTPTSASVTSSTALLGGNVTAANGSIASRGVVFAPTATNPNPQIGGTGVTHVPGNGTTTGVFTVDVGGVIAKITGTTATLKARWIPHTGPGSSTQPRFNKKFATDNNYGNNDIEGIPLSIPLAGVSSSLPVTVTATVKGLTRGAKYNWRATSGGGDNGLANTSDSGVYFNPQLTTLEPRNIAPEIGTVTAGTITATSAVITVPLTPNDNQDLNNQDTNSTVVVYGLDTNYGMTTVPRTVPIVFDPNTGDSNGFVETSLSYSLSGLQPGMTYHYKVIANNADTTFDASLNPTPASPGESPDQTFTTLPGLGNPTVTTPTFASVTGTTATLGGNVTSDGGAAVTARGVVLAPTATNPNPQLGGTGVVNVPGTGTTGIFTVNASSLTPGTAYTFKAYATNGVGTGYSTTGSFTTPGGPTVTTPTFASVTGTTATLGGNVTSDGGAAVTARGVVLAPTSANSNPQLGGAGVTNVPGTGTTGVFTVNASGLTSGTGYSFNAYATNSIGTTYTTPVATFTTLNAPTNDNLANAQTLPGFFGTVTGDNSAATKEAGEPSHAGGNAGGKSVWFQWTAPITDTAAIDTLGSSFDTVLGIYTGSAVGSLTLLASNDDDAGSGTRQSKVTFSAVAGTVYRIAVDGYNTGSGAATGSITLHYSIGATPDYTVTTIADSGTGSLRAAIAAAASGDTIDFAAVLSGQTIALGGTEMLINKNLTIDASRLALGITISGGDGTRIFSVASGALLSLRNLTLTRGNATGASTTFNDGGAIFNAGTLSLTQCTLKDNRADVGVGGAIYNVGTLSLTQCTLTSNVADQCGALCNFSTATLTHCTIARNGASNFGSTGNFGGTMTLKGCLLADSNGVSDVFKGGGTITATGVNFIGDLNGSSLTAGPAILTGAPLLDDLKSNGGPTQTMALLPGSPARNAAIGSSSTSDQRNFPSVGLADLGAYETQIGPIADTTTNQGTATGAIAFTVGTVGTLTASSSNTHLVPDASITFGGSGANRTIDVTPALNQTGTATITVTDGLSGETNSFVLTVIPTNSIAVSASPANGGTVSGGGTFLSGSSQTVTATAFSGFTFSNWTEGGIVVSTSASYTFTLTGNRTLVANFTVTYPIAELAGSYLGLLAATVDSPTPMDHEGLVQINVLKTGAFTGSVKLGGLKIPLAGLVRDDGTLIFGPSGSLFPLIRKAKPADILLGFLELKLDTTASAGRITGTLRQGGTTVATVEPADRALYTAKKNPAPPYLNVPLALADPLGNKGKYTALFLHGAAPNQGLAADGFPQGEGWAKATIAASGLVTIVGKLADGTTLSYSGPLSKTNELPVYAPLYLLKRGFLSGRVAFDPAQPQTDARAVGMKWFKPANGKDKQYPSGWPGGITVDFAASKFVVPAKATATNPNPLYVLGRDNILGTFPNTLVTLALADGGTPPPPGFLKYSFVDAKNKTDFGADFLNLKATLAASSGALTGSFNHPASNKSVKFGGVVLQKTHAAGGYFLYFPVGQSASSGSVNITPGP